MILARARQGWWRQFLKWFSVGLDDFGRGTTRMVVAARAVRILDYQFFEWLLVILAGARQGWWRPFLNWFSMDLNDFGRGATRMVVATRTVRILTEFELVLNGFW